MAFRKLLIRVCGTSRLVARNEIRAVLARTMASTCETQRAACPENFDMVAPKAEVVRFIRDCMQKAGTNAKDAEIVADHLMIADYRGHFSHGLNRMQMYVKEIDTKITDPAARPKIVNDFQAVALVDGKNALGQVVGKFCMEMAIKKAQKFGIGMVSARGSNHYGIAGYYSLMAMQYDLIGFSCTNTSPLMTPTRSKQNALGTNPISLGMAASGGDEFVLDMATTAVALGKIELAHRKGEKIPEGWALGKNGQVTTDPQDALDTYMMLPLGGEEMHSGVKGYGLSAMVEILCGILSGSNFGPNIRKWKTDHSIANLGHCFIAINPDAFACGSKDRLACLLKQLRDLPKAGDKDILVAGDPERIAMDKVDRHDGIQYHENQIRNAEQFARQIGVQPMKLVPKKEKGLC